MNRWLVPYRAVMRGEVLVVAETAEEAEEMVEDWMVEPDWRGEIIESERTGPAKAAK